MTILKSFKLFENSNNIINIINSTKIGDILDVDTIYKYVKKIHGDSDFINGDLGKRIKKYKKYKLVEINIKDLNIDEYYLFDELVSKYIKKYKENNYYPPIVITDDFILIDGNHRSNSLNKLGIKKIKAFKGIK